ncbi:MAG: DNA polymerase III subunit alpha [Ruminococcaceae bacterium]|nr:DNA polymerase III subunit alpha [Oscillospiraceae bacterium]
MGDFVHLHLHTEYSLLDGAAKISEIADKAISEGQDAVAITDHGVMYGAVEFYTALKEKGIKPIIGCEVYVASRSRHFKDGKQDSSGNHLILLCKNEVGYKNLCYMVSMSFIDGFYMKPRIDMELIREHSEGLIALSGCVAGKLPQYILSGSMEEAERTALEFRSIFGEDFYLEIQNHDLDDERKVAYGIKLISEKYNIPMVATNDVHYINRRDADMQAALTCIQTNNLISDGKPLGFETDEFYFKSTAEMKNLFSGYKGAIENSVKIAERCNFDFEFDKLHLPDFKSNDGMSHKDKLRCDAYRGFSARETEGRFDFLKHNKEEYTERMEYELSVIDKMGFNAYFLIVSDFVSYAKSAGIPVGPGRGSGAGSLVAFCVGITDVDPIAFDLLFERFLNPERVSMPDFDIDFCYNRREEVIEYVKRKYGDDKVAQIVTFGTLAARAAVRDVGRALGMPYNRVDTVAKLIPRELNISIDAALRTKELKALYEEDSEVRKLLDLSRSLEGMPRHASTHAAGVVITEKPTYEYVPLSYSGTGVVTQFDMNTDAKLGLVKFDFLGLRYLTVIQDAVSAIRKKNSGFDISNIPLDDKKTFKLLCDGKTDGVFQLESGGMKQVLLRLLPSNLEDIIASIALYRPGPMDSIDTFISRKHGREKTEYKIPELKEILEVTYGCIVYQEQVMQICRFLAGYSYARADLVRRAMSKKKADAMIAEREGFINGCVERGFSKAAAEDIFEEMVGFAKYAFNKSHATAYGIISYRTAYLKAHYPAEYFSALLTSVLDNSQKLKEYVADAQKFGVNVLPPDINSSDADFSVVDGNIRFGLLAIRNVGRQFASTVINERKNKPFVSFDEFVRRLVVSDINKRTLESLIKCGVFDSLGVSRCALISCYENIVESEQEKNRKNISGQMDLFSLVSDVQSSDGYEYPNLPEYPLRELLILEKESSGMYFSGHMIDNYSRHISSLTLDKISDIIFETSEENTNPTPRYNDKQNIKIAGIITAKKTKTVKNGDMMAFIKLEDRFGEIEVIVFARQYSKYLAELNNDNAVLISGSISLEEGEDAKILLSTAESLISNSEFEIKTKPQNSRIFIKVSDISDNRITRISKLALLNPGQAEVVIFDSSSKKYSALKGVRISSSEKVISRLSEIFGKENLVVK